MSLPEVSGEFRTADLSPSLFFSPFIVACYRDLSSPVIFFRLTSLQSPGRRFDIGGHRIEYEASDEAGWSSKCVFAVVLRQE